ncbi:hypothetical protein SDIAM103S_01585 [Streptomyces diastaticus subsp. diastaticus]|uniref:Uncharacterized protein n=1 Tax=Streptomyces griseus TaxID=1911 RepID=A0A380NF71_STRGR|nr:hypothetical protein [Streptomyces sp. DSM 41037]SUP39084.1 Uncharacterised protein [Streptomyces griseus]
MSACSGSPPSTAVPSPVPWASARAPGTRRTSAVAPPDAAVPERAAVPRASATPLCPRAPASARSAAGRPSAASRHRLRPHARHPPAVVGPHPPVRDLLPETPSGTATGAATCGHAVSTTTRQDRPDTHSPTPRRAPPRQPPRPARVAPCWEGTRREPSLPGLPRPRPAWRRDQGVAGGPGPAARWSDWGCSRETGGPAGERASPGAASWRRGQQWPGSSCAGRAYGRRHRGALTGLPCVRTGGVADWRVPGRAGTWLTDPAAGRRAPS